MTTLELLRLTIEKFKETPDSSEVVELLKKVEIEVVRIEAKIGKEDSTPKPEDVATEAIHPGNQVAFDSVMDKLSALENLTITSGQLWALNRALREQPDKIAALIREKVLPFIDSLPPMDTTIVGGDFWGEVCLDCLNEDEKAILAQEDPDDEDRDRGLSRDEADDHNLTCKRCGKHL
jgi:hypothetical protein